ncbi:hypothetical protein D3C86_1988550 [compost metagenome]
MLPKKRIAPAVVLVVVPLDYLLMYDIDLITVVLETVGTVYFRQGIVCHSSHIDHMIFRSSVFEYFENFYPCIDKC